MKLELAGDPRWICVDDKLPDETKWVLVYADGAMACRAYNSDKKQWEDWDGCRHAGLPIDFISHWMPLPEPPIGEE